MFQRILLPIDLTDRHQAAIDAAIELATREGGAIALLHVIEQIAGLSPDEEKGFYSGLERAAKGRLDRWAAKFSAKKIPVQTAIRFGHRAAECVKFAIETQADLIVLTAPRIDPANPALSLASTSYKIGIISQCPVLLVK